MRSPPSLTSDHARLQRLVAERWRAQGYGESTIGLYLRWVRRQRAYCVARGVEDVDQLTRDAVGKFAVEYAREHGLRIVSNARGALRTWSTALAALGLDVPAWAPLSPPGMFDGLLAEYREFRRRWRGVKESSLFIECRYVTRFLLALRQRRRAFRALTPADIDRFVVDLAERVGSSTVSLACSCVRAFLRFLHATGRIREDLSCCVLGPVARRTKALPRALPWKDVRRVLGAIDRSTPLGKRDYAVLLLMATYGLGAGEALGLRLDDLDWRKGTIRVMRPKTGVETLLPLLGPVGASLGSYLRSGRSRGASTRSLFVRATAPHPPMSYDVLRLRLLVHAAASGVSAPFFGTHVLRHSHACRQIEMASPPSVVSDILGHRDPASISTYARVATQRLRALCLPVPR